MTGTRKLPVTLRFSMKVDLMTLDGNTITLVVQSAPSIPFIVMTNDSQWEMSEEILFKKDAYQDSNQTTWFRFCNTLQRHFFRATKQDPSKKFRRLAPFDFNYIHQRFFGSQLMIDVTGFNIFWQWLGNTLHAMRYQRYMSKLWQNGLIYGFMNRNDVINALLIHNPGTFIIRFSENHSGRFAIAYVSLQGEGIKHYLVNQTDLGKKSFTDFLCECNMFLFILQLVGFNKQGLPVFKSLPKTETLQLYTTPSITNSVEDNDGYDPLENPFKYFNNLQGTNKKLKRTQNQY